MSDKVTNVSCKVCDGASKWLKQPFNEKGTALDWAFFVLLIMLISYGWTRILARVL